tara:strand:+ start:87 stop:479 length:393 start_codon:yes stop_codon:yes gene_type:complete
MKFTAIVALFASASALTVGKFGETQTLCQFELNDKGSCSPMGTNPETCKQPAEAPNNADCSAFVDISAPVQPVAHAQLKKKDDEGTEKEEKKECEYKANDDGNACVLKANMDGCKAPAVVPSKLPECNDQ